MGKHIKSYTPHWRPGQDKQKMRQRKRRHIAFRVLFLIIVALIIVGTAPLFFPLGKSNLKGYLYITDFTTRDTLVLQLQKEIGLSSPKLFDLYAKVVRLDNKLRKGRYAVNGKMNSYSLLKKLIREGQEPLTLSFSSIRTMDELLEKLTDPLLMTKEDLKSLLSDATYCDSLGFNPTTIKCLFLPNSYEVYWDITPRDLVAKIDKHYKAFWTEERCKLAQKEGLTPIAVSIIASIVEEESSKTDEYSRIAGLYINRLRKEKPLQADPTVKYAVGDFSIKRISYAHTQVISPYNTYKVIGLPPGPIRFPSEKTLDAVLHFEKHTYMYMCAKSDFSGYHNFATYYNEHLLNAYQYQKKLDSLGISSHS